MDWSHAANKSTSVKSVTQSRLSIRSGSILGPRPSINPTWIESHHLYSNASTRVITQVYSLRKNSLAVFLHAYLYLRSQNRLYPSGTPQAKALSVLLIE